jgi:FAD/FMN-containing dehydrogenase
LNILPVEPGTVGPCPVAPDALQGIKRQQTNPARWNAAGWRAFVDELRVAGVDLVEGAVACGTYATDAGGTAYGLPHGVVIARDAGQVSSLLKAAQAHRVPVTVRGGGLTTEGESVAFGGVLLDMTGMSRVVKIDAAALTVRTEAGIFWHGLAEELRRENLDYLSAPLNLTSSVGGTLGVGGIDVNSARLGCSADQALALQVVTPTGDIVECSDSENAELFQRVILGYGQFGIITEATLKVRPYTPLRMHYYYYSSLRTAIEDLQMLDRADASDYSGILTIMDCAVNLLVAFDSDAREARFAPPGSRACAAMASLASRCAWPGTTRCARGGWARHCTCCGASARYFPNFAAPSTCATARCTTAPWSIRGRYGNTGARATW